MSLVDFWKIGYRDKPFIMAYQASQVFYVINPTFENWSFMLHGKNNITTMTNNPKMRFGRLNYLQE